MFNTYPDPASPLHFLGLDAVSPLTHVRRDYICVAAYGTKLERGRI